MGALLALVPTKDWLYGALVIGVAVLCWHFYDKYESAVNYQVTVKAESKAALDAANQRIKDLTSDYESKLKTSEAAREQDRQAAAAQHNSDLQRLLAASARQSGSGVQGPGGPGSGGPTGSSSLGGVGSLSTGLQVLLGLADALRHDDSELSACWRERDSLTGK